MVNYDFLEEDVDEKEKKEIPKGYTGYAAVYPAYVKKPSYKSEPSWVETHPSRNKLIVCSVIVISLLLALFIVIGVDLYTWIALKTPTAISKNVSK